jgi:hypothetical protein
MASSPTLSVALLPGAEELLRVHARELPQRDDFCGAFCGSLALSAAGLRALGGAALDQDEVALAAGTTVSTVPHTNLLPAGESGRRDYRLEPPLIGEHEESGTTAAGLVRALEELSEARLAAVPFDGPWSESTIAGLFDAALELEHPATLIANVATRHFWGARASVAQLLGYLLRGELDGPRPDWDVGHFTCIGARIHGPAGTLYAILDTYPSLGARGVHVQPQERLALALRRPEMAPGGVIAVVDAADAALVRERALAAGLHEGAWDNGSVSYERQP